MGYVSFGGSTAFNGSIFAEKASIDLSGSGGITGNIVTGGSAVNVTGNTEANVRVIYAPNAALIVTGSGRIQGIVIVRSMELSGFGPDHIQRFH